MIKPLLVGNSKKYRNKNDNKLTLVNIYKSFQIHHLHNNTVVTRFPPK